MNKEVLSFCKIDQDASQLRLRDILTSEMVPFIAALSVSKICIELY